MNEIKIFENQEFGKVRTALLNDEPMFCLGDVCKALGIAQASKVKERLSEKGVHSIPTLTAGGEQRLLYINESNLYKAIFHSRKESAERFTDWVTSEVLPSIRQTGGYQMTMPQGKELLALAVLEAQKTIEAQNKDIERMKPKEIFADAVAASSTAILIGELAKLLRQNGIDIGQNRLFDWMRKNGYLIRQKGSAYNTPTQRSADLGILTTKETVIVRSDGSTEVKKTVKVTGKGQQYFINKFLKAAS
jgi:toxin-antitoxin system, toxin component, bro family|nr:MAG TPA: repressor domain protein [Caudoviricetes sp.]